MVSRLCMIGTQFVGVPALKGGAIEYLFFHVAEGLSGEFGVTFFSVNPGLNYSGKVLVERFPAVKTNGFFFSLFVLWKSLGKKFDAVYVSGCSMIFAGLLIARIKRIPLIYHEFNHNPWIKPLNFFYDFLARFSVRHSDFVVVASDCIMNRILEQEKIPEKKVIKISNFIELNEFPEEKKPKEKKILFVGRAVKHKGIELLEKIIKENSFPGWKFVFVLPEPFSSEEKNLAEKIKKLSELNQVELRQGINRKELIKEYCSASVFVLPSLQESFGLVLIEAMACFTPCVAFSVCGTKEIVDDNLNGFLVEEGNNELFAKKLAELVSDEKKRNLFGLNARKKAEQFSFAGKITEFKDFFRKVVK